MASAGEIAEAKRRANGLEDQRIEQAAIERDQRLECMAAKRVAMERTIARADSVDELIDRLKLLDIAERESHDCLLAVFQQVVTILSGD